MGLNVSAGLVPTGGGAWETHDAQYGRGGWRAVADNTARDAIPTGRRSVGMNAYNIATGATYQLGAGLTNADWTLVVFGSVLAGAGLTGTTTLSVLPDDGTITVGGSGVRRSAITGDVTIAAASNASVIAANAVTTAKILDANVTPAKFAAANAKGQSPVYNGSAWVYFGVTTKAADLTDASATVTVTDGNRMVLAASTLTASRNLTLGITGSPTDKEIITVERYDTQAFTYVVKNNAATTLYTFPASTKRMASFQYQSASSDWILVSHVAITS